MRCFHRAQTRARSIWANVNRERGLKKRKRSRAGSKGLYQSIVETSEDPKLREGVGSPQSAEVLQKQRLQVDRRSKLGCCTVLML